ncbi:MAG: DUF2752 domain-containing protein [Armatimonadetes bacterium]|uniref:DUF2752 domain-containing protein n=1 Tax=Candidatus Nitrosymbiomonas proteolyticus TaxID=2608984 RepID=A0A809R5T5_9BACT|nr:MAG: DUF2752 domain-containing protein [Armatimonadota bacterium]KXK19105.1 MAG: hypothetical protein UZ18_ATM001000701 [Armatimonadetes bacterium OLB18]MBV6490895.1 hypothetical protein [Fimbriimonadaceae bacterium]QOJ11452.1 MAG: DUF2752 domain-containing protein [Chthonomonadaceae bacterium]BBO22910.1 conserved hypothetical protein [Candidatus Nitrosymbiomonas proteolyticus]
MIRFVPESSRKNLTFQMGWFTMWLGVTIVALFLSPDPRGHGTHTQLGLPPCATAAVTGRPCPGCGLTTSFASTVRGNLAGAWRSNPFGVPLYLLFTASALASVYGFWKKLRMDCSSRSFNFALGALLVVYVGFGLVRFFTSPYPETTLIQMALKDSPSNQAR